MHRRSTNKCPLSKKKDHRCLTSLPKVHALCILTVQKGANTCIQETVKESLNRQLFIHKCNMGCPFRNCLTSWSGSDVNMCCAHTGFNGKIKENNICAVQFRISALHILPMKSIMKSIVSYFNFHS